jgi:hypothetical protein
MITPPFSFFKNKEFIMVALNVAKSNQEVLEQVRDNNAAGKLPGGFQFRCEIVDSEGVVESVPTGWWSLHTKNPEFVAGGTAPKFILREFPAFNFRDFFVVSVDGALRLFVLHTNTAGSKQTMFEYHKPVSLQQARMIAGQQVTPNETAYPYFRVRANDGTPLWKVNQSVILSSAAMDAAGLPPFMREQFVNKVREYQKAGSLFSLMDESSAPESVSDLRSVFGGA